MLEFDFRNGHLRRKYDGLKYALKTIEEILFELSLVNLGQKSTNISEETDSTSLPIKKMRIDEYSLVQVEDFNNIRVRMDSYDKERETVIKMSRDIQKLSKQSIFSVHRGNLQDAEQKTSDAKKIVDTLLKTITAVRKFN